MNVSPADFPLFDFRYARKSDLAAEAVARAEADAGLQPRSDVLDLLSEYGWVNGTWIHFDNLVSLVGLSFLRASRAEITELESYISWNYGQMFFSNNGTIHDIENYGTLIKPAARQLVSSGENLSVDWEYRSLVDNNVDMSVDWNSRTLYGPNGYESLEWKFRQLFDYLGSLSADWGSRVLCDDVEGMALDYGNRNLYSGFGHIVLSWQNHYIDFRGDGIWGAGYGPVLCSPDGGMWRLKVSNSGVISTENLDDS
ncbi:MAG: hypothetical protein LBK99_05730 [Opitutaceae bacterium]|jgi:hypothetical protein|nr:hypothetical protein [Opitutaceae bacterium]